MSRKQLSWQPGFSLSRKPVRRSIPRRKRHQQIEFVVENPFIDHQANNSGSEATLARSKSNATSSTLQKHGKGQGAEETGPFADTSLGDSSDGSFLMIDDLRMVDKTCDPESQLYSNEFQFASLPLAASTIEKQLQIFDESTVDLGTIYYDNPNHIATLWPRLGLVSASTNGQKPEHTSIPQTVEYSSISQRFKHILNRCMFLLYIFYSHSSQVV